MLRSFPVFVVSRFFIVAGLLLLALHTSARAETTTSNKNSEPLTFGFLPIISTQKLVARFAPLADYLAKELDKPVKLESAPNFAEFRQRTKKGRYDIIFTAPHFYYLAQRENNYRVLVRVNAPSMRAIIVAPKDGQVKTLSDLKGKKLSILDPLALGTVLVRSHLIQNGINPDKDLILVNTPTHNASLLSAYNHATDAASLMVPPFKRARTEVKNAMRVIDKTDGTPHMPIAVSSRVSEKDAQKIQTVLVNLKNTDEGRALLKHLSWPGFVVATPDEYDSVKWAAEQIK